MNLVIKKNRQDALLLLITTLLLLSKSSDAFPSYLLTRSNCWTTLSTEEVIMNHSVVAATASDDLDMKIHIVSDATTVTTLALKTTNVQTDPDYHYVMDVIKGECSFQGGSCEKEQRITGRAHETVELMKKTKDASCTVVAGWAAGHEAVRLTPELKIGQQQEQQSPEENEKPKVNEKDVVPRVKVVPKVNEKDQVEQKHVDEPVAGEKPSPDQKHLVADPQRELDVKHDAHSKFKDQVQKEKKKRHDKRVQEELERTKSHRMHHNLLHYEIGFETVGITWSGYVQGALFLIVTSSLFVVVSLVLSQSGEKRRRSL